MTDRETAPPRDEVAGFGWVGSLWRGLAPLLRPHGGQLAAIGLLMAVELGLQLGQRKAFGTLVDDALLKADGGLASPCTPPALRLSPYGDTKPKGRFVQYHRHFRRDPAGGGRMFARKTFFLAYFKHDSGLKIGQKHD